MIVAHACIIAAHVAMANMTSGGHNVPGTCQENFAQPPSGRSGQSFGSRGGIGAIGHRIMAHRGQKGIVVVKLFIRLTRSLLKAYIEHTDDHLEEHGSHKW